MHLEKCTQGLEIAQALTHNRQVQRSKTCCCSERKCRKIIPGVAPASVQIGKGRGSGCSDMPVGQKQPQPLYTLVGIIFPKTTRDFCVSVSLQTLNIFGFAIQLYKAQFLI